MEASHLAQEVSGSCEAVTSATIMYFRRTELVLCRASQHQMIGLKRSQNKHALHWIAVHHCCFCTRQACPRSTCFVSCALCHILFSQMLAAGSGVCGTGADLRTSWDNFLSAFSFPQLTHKQQLCEIAKLKSLRHLRVLQGFCRLSPRNLSRNSR